jgi:ubiquinone/menaquinone biosynthesis C-methylase UbiE
MVGPLRRAASCRGLISPAAEDDAVTLSARLKEFYELRAAEEPASDPESLLRFRRARRLAGLTTGERVLDLGAKWGGLADSIRESGLRVEYTALDVSEANVAAGTKRGLNFVQGDVTQRLPFADCSFDCVFCLELLEHLTLPASLLVEMRRVLGQEGRAVVSVPSPYSWVEVARELLGRHDPEGHLNCFTTPVMQNLASLTGFEIERRAGTSIRIPKTSRLIPSNSILARSRIYVLRPADDVLFAGRRMHWS